MEEIIRHNVNMETVVENGFTALADAIQATSATKKK